MITKAQVIRWLQSFAAVVEQNKDYLTELDAAIGDADHGINLDRGFKKVNTQLATAAEQDIGTILKQVSMTLISTVGGASGPLYGTFFLKASAVAAGKQDLSNEDVLVMLSQGVEGIQQRGKAQAGDKTMLDAWFPALEALKTGLASGGSIAIALQPAVAAAEAGVAATIPLIARKGRASYLGDRSRGHADPGATSSYLLLKTLLDTLEADPVS